jgi:hypothetical protein
MCPALKSPTTGKTAAAPECRIHLAPADWLRATWRLRQPLARPGRNPGAR